MDTQEAPSLGRHGCGPVKSRRELLEEGVCWSAAAVFALATGSAAFAQRPPRFPGLIVRQRQPENLEFPFDTLDSFLTPNERFYIRSHFAVPSLSASSWRLKVEGAVERPFEIG